MVSRGIGPCPPGRSGRAFFVLGAIFGLGNCFREPGHAERLTCSGGIAAPEGVISGQKHAYSRMADTIEPLSAQESSSTFLKMSHASKMAGLARV